MGFRLLQIFLAGVRCLQLNIAGVQVSTALYSWGFRCLQLFSAGGLLRLFIALSGSLTAGLAGVRIKLQSRFLNVAGVLESSKTLFHGAALDHSRHE